MFRATVGSLLVLLASAWLSAQVWAEDASATPPAETKAPAAKSGKKGKQPQSFEPRPNDAVVECENFTLTAAETVEAPDASGGKCIQFTDETSKAQIKLDLKAGRYAVDVYMKCQNLAHDTIYLSALGKEQIKVFPSHAKLPQTAFVRVPVDEERGKPLVLELDKDQSVALTLSARETGMLIDRVVLRKLAESAKP